MARFFDCAKWVAYGSQMAFCCLVACLLTLSSCQNNGDIGELYGQWQLLQMQIDGQNSSPEGYYMSFQSTTMWVKTVNEYDHNYLDCFGHYVRQGDSLIVRFKDVNELKSVEQVINQRFRFSESDEARFLLSLDEDRLVLTSGQRSWIFKKY